METNQQLNAIDMKTKLSTLWIFVLFNVLFRDIHELFRPGFLAEMMTGTINGNVITEEFMLIAGILLEISIGMVLLSRILDYKINRWANIIASGLTILFMLANGVHDLDDIWFLSMSLIALTAVIWLAWRWVEPNNKTKIRENR